MQRSQLVTKDLVLIGGGHSHAIVLRMLGMKPIPGIRVTLITEASDTPYSGMLPGHVAGFYTHEECHIDLRRLAQFARVQFYRDLVVGLDLVNKKVICANRPPVAYDLLSVDIGSTPAQISVPGAAEYAIPAKPVAQFLQHWYDLCRDVTTCRDVTCNVSTLRLGIVGGGAGGVELAMAMQGHLQSIRSPQPPLKRGAKSSRLFREEREDRDLEIHLFQRGAELMPNYNSWVRHRCQEILIHKRIQLHLQETVCEIQSYPTPYTYTGGFPNPPLPTPYTIKCESGLQVECDRIFWVTQASAPDWLQAAGIATDERGFILVNDALQSVSHPDVFAAGDIASMVNYPRPKAGVFAVRQGKPLFKNLRRALLGRSLQPYKPQKQYLSLIGTGDGKAIAAWGKLGFGATGWLWRWKDAIDRKFMQRFSNLPQMQEKGQKSKVKSQTSKQIPNSEFRIPNSEFPMPCAGCGSKVSSTVLARVLNQIKQDSTNWCNRQDIIIGLDAPDDAAVVEVPGGLWMVHTIDHFHSLINDPYIFGQITANHCLSDIFAMGATPQSALAIATIPYALESKTEETLYQLLSGAVKVLADAQTPLVGGHTTEGSELEFGLSCNGLVHPNKLLRKGGMQPGQVLILTKALGTGTLFAAEMQRETKGDWIDRAVTSMLQSNQVAAACLMAHGATACTDVTGFGLAGHLYEMVRASRSVGISACAVDLNLAAIPALEGAIATLQKGIVSSLQAENLRIARFITDLNIAGSESLSPSARYSLLFDPQTSGGLLASIPAEQASQCLDKLHSLGYAQSCIIGKVVDLEGDRQPITINLSNV
ncbi:selenide, water dikinase SelD [Chroococcidiopsis thermalis]|uniref:Selenophosphate synthase n=1 Tax=Chroococcidiopsis thermalis (strain PCC 7203) TaxID=251229 RepID=K9TTX6_CHRTP|nr:selenide, water dikinase SelD [Chroococcidiopsis thermalis]AFY86020.1 selenophosphate synthase [Chroococcidiopsis thermalis PCC 7203]